MFRSRKRVPVPALADPGGGGYLMGPASQSQTFVGQNVVWPLPFKNRAWKLFYLQRDGQNHIWPANVWLWPHLPPLDPPVGTGSDFDSERTNVSGAPSSAPRKMCLLRIFFCGSGSASNPGKCPASDSDSAGPNKIFQQLRLRLWFRAKCADSGGYHSGYVSTIHILENFVRFGTIASMRVGSCPEVGMVNICIPDLPCCWCGQQWLCRGQNFVAEMLRHTGKVTAFSAFDCKRIGRGVVRHLPLTGHRLSGGGSKWGQS